MSHDQTVAISLAVAMREGLARLLGVESEELGWGAVRTRTESGAAASSSILYDRAAGGAGFASTAAENLDDVLNRAADVLDCRNPGCGLLHAAFLQHGAAATCLRPIVTH